MGHSHAEDRSTYYLEQLCTIAVCGLLGGVTVMLYTQNMLRYILVPQLHIYVFWSGVTLLILAGLRGLLLWQSVGRGGADCLPDPVHDHHHGQDHEHPHTHAHEDCCAHEHEHSHLQDHDHAHGHDHSWNPWRYIVLLLPIVLYFLGLPNAGLTSKISAVELEQTAAGTAVENTGMRINKDAASDLLQIVAVAPDGPADKAGLKVDDVITQITSIMDEEGKPLDRPEIASSRNLTVQEAVDKLRGPPQTKVQLAVQRARSEPLNLEIVRSAAILNLEFKELERAAYTADQRRFYAGKIGRLKGQFFPGNNDRTFSLARIKITCCAADAIPLNIVIMLDPASKEGIKNAKPQQWVQVTGEIQFRKRRDRDEYVTVLLVASPKDVRETDPDLNPYIQ
jgi:hypothetical protein